MERRGWILREGYPFIIPPAIAALLGYATGLSVLGTIGILAALGVALFFRNPSRKPLRLAGAALSPADGKVVEVSRLEIPDFGAEPVCKISIFMSVFNVHVNRSPVYGEVVDIRREHGAFRPAHHGESSDSNERNVISLRMKEGQQLTCVQVAGVLARSIVCWIKEGVTLKMGESFGMIRFGSRVDCYFPSDFDPDVRIGQRVWGGETVLGYFHEERDAKR